MLRAIVPVIMMMAAFTGVEAQESRTLVKSFNVTGMEEVIVDLPCSTEIAEWTEDVLQIEVNIAAHPISSEGIKALIVNGRYDVFDLRENGTLTLKPNPKMERMVKYGNEPVIEHVTYLVKVPVGMPITLGKGVKMKALPVAEQQPAL